jgi:DNA-binding NtrC family response regulator
VLKSVGHVLLIDDDEQFRTLVAARLKRHQLQVTEVATRSDAIQALSRERFTFALIDNQLGTTAAGLDLAKRCLANGIREFAIVTGSEDDETAKSLLQL